MLDYDSGPSVMIGPRPESGPLLPPKAFDETTESRQLQKKSVLSLVSDANPVPSTPNSLRHARQDSIDNETSPSSFNELDESPQQDTEETNFSSGAPASFNLGKFHLHDIDPLHIPPDEDPLPDKLAGHLHLHKFKTSLSLSHHRRHTAPPEHIQLPPEKLATALAPQKTPSAAAGPNPTEVAKRSTFPTPQKSAKSRSSLDLFNRPLNSFDSTNSEIQRMRNTFVIKRNIKKRRKDFLEDDKVLIGNKISEGHENFVMAYNMLTGIRVAVSRCSGVMKKLSEADFHSDKKLTFNMDGSELTPSSKYDFKFKDYCPEVFRELRTLFGLDPADYLISITGKYILSELGSPGKSGSFFYFSRDYRYIIKTIHHSEHKQLRRILKHYYNHVKANPNTLISQIYGLHRVKMPFMNGVKRKVHFLVMNNLFPPHRDIHLKYDLKGSTWGRFTETNKDTDFSKVTLKDLNWLERDDKIKFGPDKRKLFFKQLEIDVRFLESINVMDYSLLMGIHDVKKGNNEEQLNKLSVFDPKSQNKTVLINTNPISINREDLPTEVFKGRSKFIFYGHDGGIRSTNENNEPSGDIYYMGVIDFLTNYSIRKRLETFWRTLNHNRSTISAVPAREYGERFLKFIKKGTTNAKSKAL